MTIDEVHMSRFFSFQPCSPFSHTRSFARKSSDQDKRNRHLKGALTPQFSRIYYSSVWRFAGLVVIMFQQSFKEQTPMNDPDVQDNPFRRPGYGLPLDFAPMQKNVYGIHSRSLFPNANDDRDIKQGNADQPLQTLREFNMLRIMEGITDTPEWYKRIHEDNVAEAWKKDAIEKEPDITPNMANWIIDELRFKSALYEHSGAIALYNGDVTKSDININDDFRVRLLHAVNRLEDVPQEMRFYNPGTDYKQEDLIPVAFCCLVYGRSRVLPDKIIGTEEALKYIGQGEIIPVPEETGITREDITTRVATQVDIATRPYSRQFQMLPFEMNLGEDGKWHITSYINNLHPDKYRELYELIEELFNKVTDQLEITLTPLKDMLHSRARIEYRKAEYYPLPKEVEEQMPQPGEREAEIEFEDRLQSWRMANLKVVQPDCGKFIPWAVPQWMMNNIPMDLSTPLRVEQEVLLGKDYAKHGLQLITRIFNIHLSPDKPRFESGWHGAGQMNDHVIASAFVTIDLDNATVPLMSFRHLAETTTLGEVEHHPEDTVWLKQIFGLSPGDAAIQEPGKIRCFLNRMVMFPSTVQHRYEGMELVDNSRTGTVKAFGLFLVDPNIRITSTANVPPQRLDWAFQGADYDEFLNLNMSLDKLSMGFQNQSNLPFSMSEAKRWHAQALKETIEFTKYTDVAWDSKKVNI